uniref:Septin-type G domain-containing protein n=1 Tax=Meloidogyne incognita TaxID=6306 RepID=A0A914LUZ0_MELIC
MSTITEAARVKNGISSLNSNYVCFADFPNQVFRRCLKNGFEFSLMVVGQSGLGKSTFLNTLFMAELLDRKHEESSKIKSTVSIESKTFRLTENDVKLKLTVVDTPGFGDFIDNSKCWEPIVKYIDDRFADYLAEETKIDRSARIEDKRVHLCIYFIPPTGHGLKQLDITFMQALQDRVNIVPVIAKADTLTATELGDFKHQIMEDMRKNNISLYKPPDFDYEQQQLDVNGWMVSSTNGRAQSQHNAGNSAQLGLSKRFPFAIIGSTHVKEILVGGEQRATKQRVRVREYPWGIVQVDNLGHNDFVALRDMIRNNLIDLIEVTKSVHYENYRMRNLPQSVLDADPCSQLEKEIFTRQIEAENALRKKEDLFHEDVAIREQRLKERTLAIDATMENNRKALEEKHSFLAKLKQEIADAKKLSTIALEEDNLSSNISNNNNSSNVNSRKNTLPPDLPASLAKPAKIPRLNSSIAPLPVVNNNDINLCKGISQQNLESSPSFFTTKPSSKLGLVLHKAEVEGRDYQQKITPKQQQDVIAVKWQERNQDREIRDDLTRKIQERDKQIRDRKSADVKREAPDITIINLDSTSNLITPNEGNNNILEGNNNNNSSNTSRKNILSTDLPASIAKPAKIPRLNPFIAPLPAVVNTNIYPSKGIHQQDLESSPSFFTTKPSSKLGLVLYKAEVEGRNYQQKITLQLQQTNDTQSSIGENFVSNKDGSSSVKRYEYNQDRELREDLTRKIQERDKQIRDRTESLF